MDTLGKGDNSVLSKSEEYMRVFLDTNTSLTDNEKATMYAKFITDITTNTMTQAIGAGIQISLEAPVNAQRILNLQGELIVAKNEVSVKIAKAKAEVELVIPAEVASIRKDIEIKSRTVVVEEKKANLLDKDIILKGKQVLTEDKKIGLMTVQTTLESERIPLMKAEALLAGKKVTLMGVQVSTELKKVGLMEKQALVEAEKIPLIKAQTMNESAKEKLTISQTRVEDSKVKLQRAEIDLRYADVFYRQQQAQTVANSLLVNERIENNKNETTLKVAVIQASSI